MKALPNNNKPATHFVEAVSGNMFYNSRVFSIGLLEFTLALTDAMPSLKTIAIFKIRLK